MCSHFMPLIPADSGASVTAGNESGVLALPVSQSRVHRTGASAWRFWNHGGARDISPKPSRCGFDRQPCPCHLSLTQTWGGPPGMAPAGKPTAPL